MLEWLKRLVARRELAELDELRREMLILDFGRSVDRHQDWIKKFAAESDAASHEEPRRGVDYRFLGMTGEEDA
ncbi:Uncharacterised protein [Burkholderia pseudomallei]|uniref:hypothetical protein n=1 Tax=Burkholderia pseudomallei TaxID=28450 RepID=UPI0003A16B0F|nr:hypothetical protein [Burkholderia pseudomallei]MCE2035814.1 hypothetical protein [Burkholderia pseudomallei CS]MCE2041822.1 hypothetical protein [Burkholderia pseudomallei CB]OAG64891.1 hypothetical protein BIM11_5777 [Burkholderia pseudomallei]CPG13121.1 Uncharacterised protein [Burkholderia pseudomallei]